MKHQNQKTLDYYMSLPYRMEIVPDTEEGGFTAWFPELPGCITCAETIEDVITDAIDSKKAWIEAALEDNTPIAEPVTEAEITEYSGQFKLRIPRSLHRSLSIHAKNEGISMNQYCLYLLSRNDSLYAPASHAKNQVIIR
ncbi:MAG: toxin-antitoxin system HicB family antitoxin [Lachnospiraceae bacterium]|nr:toxin-antitoxin system HicB family antitoxin [Lachnospiraceae bacterium]